MLESFGRSVADRIAAEGRRTLPLARALSFAVAVAEALGQIHELDVIHKNVIPRNILVDSRSGRHTSHRLPDLVGTLAQSGKVRPPPGISKARFPIFRPSRPGG